MATTKKPTSKPQGLQISWKKFFISLSVAANIGFAVVIITMMTSHVLDGMFMREGLNRYCATQNDEKFSDNSEKVKALREYTCARGDAKDFFNQGLNDYMESKGITIGS
jgi:hypothetical protein